MEDSKITTIIEAARNRFAHYGLTKTTMNEIAADIGMSKASLYYYFPDKENLFVAVIEQDFSEFVETIYFLISKPSKASFKLKKYIQMRNQLLNKLLTLAKIERSTVSEVLKPVFSEHRQKLLAKEKEMIGAILELGIKEGEFIKFNVGSYSDLFVSALVGIRAQSVGVTFIYSAELEEKINGQASLFVDIFLKSIQKAPLLKP